MAGRGDSDEEGTEAPPGGGRAPLRGLGGSGLPASGGGGGPRLEVQVAELREQVAQLVQELHTHRQVLEQFIEVREGCMELLEHRSGLLQCLELREGLQAVRGELIDKAAELDLSLAGVSDNTARHGKALGNLAEQQKRTAVTLDAIVRAVKRLDRSRSRSRDHFASMGPTMRTDDLSPGPALLQQVDEGDGLVSFSAPPTTTSAGGGDGMMGFGSEATEGREWWNAPCGGGSGRHSARGGPRSLGDGVAAGLAGGEGAPLAGGGDGLSEDDPWHWPGWSTGRNDEPELAVPAEDVKCGSAPSSPTSTTDAALQQQRSLFDAVPRSRGSQGGTTPTTARRGRGPQPGPSDQPTSPGSARGGQSNTEMAHCVKGVLARIEEALTKLDGSEGPGGSTARQSDSNEGLLHPDGGHHRRGPRGSTPLSTPRDGPGSLEAWEAAGAARRGGAGGGGYVSTRHQRGGQPRASSRTHSASATRRSARTAAACASDRPASRSGCTPRTRRSTGGQGTTMMDWPREVVSTGSWRPADSWA